MPTLSTTMRAQPTTAGASPRAATGSPDVGSVKRPRKGRGLDLVEKLAVLADAAKYDASCASSGARRRGTRGRLGHTDGVGICHSYTPDGRCVSLLKLLLTNYCIYDCRFCVNRVSSTTHRARFTPGEVVRLTIDFYRRNYIEGLFLSSGIIQSPDYTMEQLIEVARALRADHGFGGYIHLKAVPGADGELLTEAGRWADRLSANVELPSQDDLDQLAPEKQMRVIEGAMATIHERRREATEARRSARTARSLTPRSRPPRWAPAGQSTQMVVGATDTRDAAILSTASRLYRTHRLKRIYYSAFSPIPHGDARLPAEPPPLLREHRLYQADWLLRFYGFRADELVDARRPDLDLELDPKTAWALEHRDFFPIDVNRASLAALLRVPGIGVRNARRIVRIRRWRALRIDDLAKLRIVMRRALPFLVAADRNPEALRLDHTNLRRRILGAARPGGEQLSLFDSTPARPVATSDRTSSLHGEL
ncbi:MAG: putative DNA modification/repair radical SAM protein [Acidobacteriota bacterium]